jgi:dienelactone hydrolase
VARAVMGAAVEWLISAGAEETAAGAGRGRRRGRRRRRLLFAGFSMGAATVCDYASHPSCGGLIILGGQTADTGGLDRAGSCRHHRRRRASGQPQPQQQEQHQEEEEEQEEEAAAAAVPPAVLIVHGAQDSVCPAAGAGLLRDKARQAGREVTLRIVAQQSPAQAAEPGSSAAAATAADDRRPESLGMRRHHMYDQRQEVYALVTEWLADLLH